MKTLRSFALAAATLALAACSDSSTARKPVPGPDTPLEPYVPATFSPAAGTADANDIALFLAGKPVRHGAALSQMQLTGDYRTHADLMAQRWRRFTARRTLRQSQWSDAYLAPTIGSPGTVIYPFGGPDLLHVMAMFPRTSTYVLLGLEPSGSLPALESQPPGAVLADLFRIDKAMETQLKVGYFITKDMRAELSGGPMPGTTPLLLASIGLMDGTVESIQSIKAGGNTGVDIRFRLPYGGSRRVIYMAGDLSNGGFGGGYRSWLGGFGGSVAYFKAASYLTHEDSFSGIRDFVLKNCRAVVQDDSGIPHRFFGGWDARLFGRYDRPIELFANKPQPDLRAAYDAIGRGPDIPFGSGYHYRASEANLQMYVRK
jgi:hypothetical protein